MTSWAGFSEEELRRIQNKVEPNENVAGSLGRGRRSAPTNRNRQQLQRERALQMAAKQQTAFGDSYPLSHDQKLQSALSSSSAPSSTAPSSSVPSPSALSSSDPSLSTSSSSSSAPSSCATHPKDPGQPSKQDLQQHPQPEDPPGVQELDTQEVELREKTRLQQLQWEQRMMEEKNKRTKALLAKTIAEKSKQTQAEAVKLKKIQCELQVLDDSVSSDIGVLRRLIDQASMEYSTAWKRMEKAEAEYVAAKLDLHKKTEVKEQLTEHLCAIIQQNELRKARKLEELMLQLELSMEQGCGDGESPAHPDTVNESQVNIDSTAVSENSVMTVEKTTEGQGKELITNTVSAEG